MVDCGASIKRKTQEIPGFLCIFKGYSLLCRSLTLYPAELREYTLCASLATQTKNIFPKGVDNELLVQYSLRRVQMRGGIAVEFMTISAKAARVNANLKLDQAAGELGITRRTLQNYEAGRTSPPWELVEKMSKLYKYPIGGLSFALQSPKSAAGDG